LNGQVKRKKYFLKEKNKKQGVVEIEEDEEEDKNKNRTSSQCFFNRNTSGKIYTRESCNKRGRFKQIKYPDPCQSD
jgi:hypothetical protein